MADLSKLTREELGERFRALIREYDAACMSYDHARASDIHRECYALEAEFCRRDGRQPSAAGLGELDLDRLLDRFKEAAIAYDEADGPEEAERLYWELQDAKSELKRRPGDRRWALFALYTDTDIRVRAQAAEATRTLAPELSRDRLGYIDDDAWAAPPSGLDITKAGLAKVFIARRAEEHPFRSMPVEQLVQDFACIAIEQDKAQLYDQTAKYNRLFHKIVAIKDELKRREGDQRRALVSLFEHPNAQVRLMAAQWASAVAPAAAQAVLQKISDQNEYPQAAHARQSLEAIDRGDSKLI
jgi:Domain of unknown function (DUF2019)